MLNKFICCLILPVSSGLNEKWNKICILIYHYWSTNRTKVYSFCFICKLLVRQRVTRTNMTLQLIHCSCDVFIMADGMIWSQQHSYFHNIKSSLYNDLLIFLIFFLSPFKKFFFFFFYLSFCLFVFTVCLHMKYQKYLSGEFAWYQNSRSFLILSLCQISPYTRFLCRKCLIFGCCIIIKSSLQSSSCHWSIVIFVWHGLCCPPPSPFPFPISLSLNPTAPSHTNIIIQPCKYVQVNAFFSHSH